MGKTLSPWSLSSLSKFTLNKFTKNEFSDNSCSFNIFKLAHYSSCRKGSALFYRAIRFQNLLRHYSNNRHFNLEKSISAVRSEIYNGTNSAQAPTNELFSYFFYGVSSIRQSRSWTSKFVYRNSINNFGHLSHNYLSGEFRCHLKKISSLRNGHHYRFFRWSSLQNQAHWIFNSVNSRRLERSYWNNLKIRSFLRFNNFYSFNSLSSLSDCNPFGVTAKSLFLPVAVNITSMVYFIRTIWFRNLLNTNLSLNLRNHSDYSSNTSMLVSSFGSLSFPFSIGFGSQNIMLSTSKWDDEFIDPDRFSKSPSSARKRRFFNRKHFTLRIGLGFWGKKLWQFRKSRKFWNYVRSLYGYFFRSFKTHNAFKNRLDVFILRFFAVRNILYARSLIKAGHVFVGTFNPRSPMYQVERHGIVTLSKKALIWTSGRNYVHSETYFSRSDLEIKSIRRTQKNSALRFARQQKDLYMIGGSKFFKYAMFYGDDSQIIFSDSRKSKFFSLNYFYSQKVVNSAWW